MSFTVAICTWNRARLLEQTLGSLQKLRVSPGISWDVLVVDNNCSDDTAAVADGFASSLPIRRVVEPTPGLSHARNRAVAESTGDLIVFADDDVLVDPDWLTEYARAAVSFPEAGVFGGTIEPWFATEPPAWISRHFPRLEGIYAIRRLGAETRELGESEEIYGANMAFRRGVLERLRFDPTLGRRHGEMIHGEETDLLVRVREAGWSAVWVGSARVRHYIPAERMTSGYVRRYFAGLGRTQQRRAGMPDSETPRLLGAPRWMYRRFASEWVRSVVRKPWRDEAWLESLRTSAVLGGRIAECRAISRKGVAA